MEMIAALFNDILFVILAVNVIYLLFFSVAGLFNKKVKSRPVLKNNRFAIFIPAYKGDSIILNTVNETFQQFYPRTLYDIIVIGDSLNELTVGQLRMLPIKFVEVKFENSTKVKSIIAGIKALEGTGVAYDYAILLDIDNIMEIDFLAKINQTLQRGQLALQGHRIAKNSDSSFAILDGISEEINNHIFRKGHHVLGLSSAMIGSGKAIEYNLFSRLMKEITAVGGFDKELEILLISRGILIDYDDDAIVFDEKVQQSSVFQNQRKRWMAAQLAFMKKYTFKGIITSIRTRNIDFFDKCIQLLLLPRLINLGLLIVLSGLYFAGYNFGMGFIILLVMEIVALSIAIPKNYYNLRTLKALMQLPNGFMLMVLNVFKLKGVNKKFIHTPHSVTKVD